MKEEMRLLKWRLSSSSDRSRVAEDGTGSAEETACTQIEYLALARWNEAFPESNSLTGQELLLVNTTPLNDGLCSCSLCLQGGT